MVTSDITATLKQLMMHCINVGTDPLPCDDDIAAMPMQYNTLVGDMGTMLSGGKKQRLLLARALYRQPSILFLDEATSHLDVARECNVNETTRELKLTRIIAAHRPETIASADRVIVLNDGRIVSDGTTNPASMLMRKILYNQLAVGT